MTLDTTNVLQSLTRQVLNVAQVELQTPVWVLRVGLKVPPDRDDLHH